MKSRASAFRALIFFLFAAMLAGFSAERASAAAKRKPAPLPVFSDENLLWVFPAKGVLVSSPCVSADGLTVYIGSGDRRLYAIDTFSGESKWTNGVRLPAPIFSSPIVNEDGLIYVGCQDGRLYAISDHETYGQIERFGGRTAGTINATPALDEDGTIYVGSSDNHLYAFFPDGARKWLFAASNNVGTPMVNDDGSILAVSGGFLYQVSPDGGSEGSFTPRSAIRGLPALGPEGTIYIGGNDERFYALDGVSTNSQRWRFRTGGNIESSPAVGADGRVYFASDDRHIYCLTTNGAVRWTVATRGIVRAPLSIGVDGTIYAGCDDKRLYAISADGELLWTFKTKGAIRSSPALDAFGVVYVSSGRLLYALQTEAMADDSDEPAWQMFRKDAQHTARATECRPFLIVEPQIDGLPQYTVTNGESVSISFTVRAGAPVSIAWRFNGVEIDPEENPTATNATLVIEAPTALNAGTYTVHAQNDCGEVESDVFTLDVNAEPSITQEPTNQFLLAGNTLTLRVTAVGSPPLTYQWKKDDVAVPFGTNSVLTITNAQPADSGTYSVMVMNPFGSVTSTSVIVRVFAYTPAIARRALGAGHRHSLAVLTNLTLWAWGLDNFGQLGDGGALGGSTNSLRNLPQLIGTNGAPNTNAVWASISAGGRGFNASSNDPGGFSIGIQTNGTLWAWGENDRGQLGAGTFAAQTFPRQVGTDTNWVQAEAGATHVIALKRDGSLWAWGANEAGQLGIGSTVSNSAAPVRVGTESAWIEVRAGGFFSLARRADGTIWAWGTNSFGQLGIGTNRLQRSPTMIGTNAAGEGADWAAISAGAYHALALKSNGTLWAWGRNNFGQLGLALGAGNGTEGVLTNNRPARVGGDSDWAFIEAGSFHSFAIKSNGMLFAWGANYYGQLGDGANLSGAANTNEANRISPEPVATDRTWREVDASDHSLGMTTDGRIWAWGLNNFGQVGDGTGGDGTLLNNRNVPVLLGFNIQTNSGSGGGGETNVTGSVAITQQPSSQIAGEGNNVTFSVMATGTPSTLAFQWYFSSNAIAIASNATATSSNLVLTNLNGSQNAGYYFVVVANGAGSVTSAVAGLTITNASGVVFFPDNAGGGGTPLSNSAPFIIQGPTNHLATPGANVDFVVLAEGARPLFYQWYSGTNAIDPSTNLTATNATLTLTNVQTSASLKVVVSNHVGSVTSALAILLVSITPPGSPAAPVGIGEIHLDRITIDHPSVRIAVTSDVGPRRLVLEYTDALENPVWIPVSTNEVSDRVLTDPAPPLDRARYYRVRAE